MPRSSRPPSGDAWVLAGPAAALSRLEPLVEAHRARRPVRLVASLEAAAPYLDSAAALLVVGEGTPGRSLAGVFVRAPGGARVPVGWLPDAGPRLAVFARAAAEVQGRDGEGPFAILGELDARALALAAEVAEALGKPAFLWTAERLSRVGLIEALRCGPGVGLYVGHGLGRRLGRLWRIRPRRGDAGGRRFADGRAAVGVVFYRVASSKRVQLL